MPVHPAPSPQEEARLRRLLADARHEAPVPADIATRLDEVLGRLEAGEDVPSGISGTGVLELAAARRRRAASMLVAAAAVIAVGIGLGQVVDLSGSGTDSSGSAEESLVTADRDEERSRAPDRSQSEPESEGGSDTGDSTGLTSGSTLSRDETSRGVVVVDRRLARVDDDSFGDDAAVVQRRAISVGGGASARIDRLRAAPRPVARRWQDCAPAEWGEGLLVAVLYDGEPAVLAFRAPAGDSQVADLLQCGTGGVLRSTTLTRR